MKLIGLLFLSGSLLASACSVDQTCNGGCLCYSVSSCPTGCYVTQAAGGGATFCGNGIVSCGGGAWATGTPRDNCGSGTAAVSTDAGPSGAFCCSPAPDAGTD